MSEELFLDYYFESLENFMFPEVFKNVEYPWEALDKTKDLFEKFFKESSFIILGQFSENSNFSGNIYIGEGTKIDPEVYIEGPAIIGKNCTIRHGAMIRPGTILSDDCVVGHGCEIKNSIVFKGAKIQSMTFVGDSVIGAGARVGSGTITANRRFDQGDIGVKLNNVFYSFKRDFFGCVLGDFCRLGANSVTLPGTLIGPYTWVMPLTQVKGFIPKAKIITNNREIVMRDNEVRKLKS